MNETRCLKGSNYKVLKIYSVYNRHGKFERGRKKYTKEINQKKSDIVIFALDKSEAVHSCMDPRNKPQNVQCKNWQNYKEKGKSKIICDSSNLLEILNRKYNLS